MLRKEKTAPERERWPFVTTDQLKAWKRAQEAYLEANNGFRPGNLYKIRTPEGQKGHRTTFADSKEGRGESESTTKMRYRGVQWDRQRKLWRVATDTTRYEIATQFCTAMNFAETFKIWRKNGKTGPQPDIGTGWNLQNSEARAKMASIEQDRANAKRARSKAAPSTTAAEQHQKILQAQR